LSDHARLLLDTHALLWVLSEPKKLRPDVREMISDGASEVYVSAASAWEIEVKQALGKLRAPEDLERQLAAARLEELPVRIKHAAALRRLPPLHRDPFDRLLIAQAQVEQLTLVTRDEKLRGYDVALLEA
jgi:PIN domain nuclease of toxin-antitoxin system